jgi:3',5'-nucleoside bisphosphate phosphatase
MIDLHVHTTFSDGASSPQVLIQEAHNAGLRALAITDHDTLAGFDAAMPFASRSGLELMCGVEVSTSLAAGATNQRTTVHLLGYFLDQLPSTAFKEWLAPISSTRRERNFKLIAHLQKKFAIQWTDFQQPPESLSRTHFARLLVAKGYVPDQQSAFDLHLSDQSLAGIERPLPSVLDGIVNIRAGGGLASLAHPVRLPFQDPGSLRCFIHQMAGCGLQGLEVYHSDHTAEQTQHFLELARDLSLVITGGSDYHGANKPGIRLGTGRGDLRLPYSILEQMRSVAQNRRVRLP